jgi:hypothetical protein
MRSLVSLVLVGLVVGCASPRPVYYPNATLERVGDEGAAADFEDCTRIAKESGAAASDAERAGEIAADTAGRAGAGGAAGAVGGAIRGSNVGIAAAVGAGVAATWGVVRAGFRWMFGARDPDPIERRFVERCLEERGYDVIGWR